MIEMNEKGVSTEEDKGIELHTISHIVKVHLKVKMLIFM